MRLDQKFIDIIKYNDTLTQKQFDILEIKKDDEKDWEKLVLLKDVSKNDKNLLMLLKNIDNLEVQEQLIKNYNMVLEYNNITAKVYEIKDEIKNIENQNEISSIYCDGACSGNPGNAGSGIAIFFKNENLKPKLLYGDFVEFGTNNIAELNALYKALLLASNSNSSITIFTDSKYSIDCISTWAYSWKKNGWSKKGGEIKNLDLIIKSHELYEKLKNRLKLEYVKGHNGVLGNELADKMALYAISKKNVDFQSLEYESIEDVFKLKKY